MFPLVRRAACAEHDPASEEAAAALVRGYFAEGHRELAVRASSMVRHYHGSTVYPADMSYLRFRDGLALFEQGGCASTTLGTALRRELGPKERRVFIGLLPAKVGREVRGAL